MGDTAKKILFVNSEMMPYLPENQISSIGRGLSQGIQERRHEIRSFMPRWGCINERKNQLHEVIRLSGMNIIINEVDRPLVIKVASISAARIQVYFIDNDDYFKRKRTYTDENGEFYPDNNERAIFFARGVLETVKKLRWAPDIIHCQGWMSHILPVYLKKVYNEDPIFSSCKIVLSLFDDTPEKFSDNFASLLKMGSVKDSDVSVLEQASGINLAKLAIQYSDGVIFASQDIDSEIVECCSQKGVPTLPYDAASYEDGSYIDQYNAFYETV